MVWWALLNSVTAHSFPPTCWYQACAEGEKADQLPINSRSTPDQLPINSRAGTPQSTGRPVAP